MNNIRQRIGRVKKYASTIYASKKVEYPPDLIMFVVLFISLPVVITYFFFGRFDGYLEVNRPEAVDVFSPESNNRNDSKFNCGDPENRSQITHGDIGLLAGSYQGKHGKENGLSSDADSVDELLPRSLGVTEHPRLFGTTTLKGLTITWDVRIRLQTIHDSAPPLTANFELVPDDRG